MTITQKNAFKGGLNKGKWGKWYKISKKNKRSKKQSNMNELTNIKNILEFGITIVIAITALILLCKMLFKKVDKNKNGKIETEEITEADVQFCKELLKESIKTIALGIHQQSGMTSKQINNLMLEEIKKAKTLINETIENQKENK